MTFPHSESQVCVNACDPECGKCRIGRGRMGRCNISGAIVAPAPRAVKAKVLAKLRAKGYNARA